MVRRCLLLISALPEAVAHALLGHSNLRIVTSNLNVANANGERGFSYYPRRRRNSAAATSGINGEATQDFIARIRLDFGILGISGGVLMAWLV
ncbi:hypothetical protein KCP76_07845 [Salmonella enterica subsp. enterica serovar Weltevreden]|nr:hypothetical protein KCP76_07845 [Salmonella enterica subsp. enterica serovar Weltevreden]